jgi:hypothetical protein
MTLYRMIERKEIASLNIGGRTLFDRKDLDELIERAKTSGAQPIRKKGGHSKPHGASLGREKSTKELRTNRQK